MIIKRVFIFILVVIYSALGFYEDGGAEGNLLKSRDTLENRFSIDSLVFDTSTNFVNVYWQLDSSGVDDSIKIYAGIAWSFTNKGNVNALEPSSFERVFPVLGVSQVDFGHDLLFESNLFIGIWMKAVIGADTITANPYISPSDEIIKSITTPSFKWQKVHIPSVAQGSHDETYSIANGNILFEQTTGAELIIDRVEVSNNLVDSSFVNIGAYNVHFKKNTLVPLVHFKIGFKIPSLPIPLEREQVGIYRVYNGNCSFIHESVREDSILWVSYSAGEFINKFPDTTNTMTLLADTLLPVIGDSISTPLLLADTSSSISTSFTTSDNVTNALWKIQYLRGNVSIENAFKDSGFCNSKLDTVNNIRTENLSSVLFPLTGSRVILTLSDGINRVYRDISIKVTGKISSSFSFKSGQWAPVFSKASLLEDSLYNILNSLDFQTKSKFPKGWDYNKTEQRFFRYINVNGTDTATGWLEYSDTTAQYFNLSPGVVFWGKSREDISGIQYGNGTSNSLSTPYSFAIASKGFTDFTTPYYFNILLKDLIDANDRTLLDSINIYRWEEDTSTGVIGAIPVLLKDSIQLEDTLFSSGDYVASSYTIYNSSSQTILKIPGISSEISSYYEMLREPLVNKRSQNYKKRVENKRNLIALKWKTYDSGEWGKLLLSFGLENRSFSIPAPATFGNVKTYLTLADSATESFGYVSKPYDESGVANYKLIIENRSDKRKIITLSPEIISTLDKKISIRFVNNGVILEGESRISVDAGKSIEIPVIAGSVRALDNSLALQKNMRFAFLKNFPNPFTVYVNLEFQLPLEVKKYELSIFNTAGREVYRLEESDNVNAGKHNILLGRESGLGNLSSGAYFIKLKAFKKNGVLKTLSRKLICVK